MVQLYDFYEQKTFLFLILENSFIEMGAQWIHGTRKNPIFELSKSLDLLDDRKSNNFGLKV